LVLRGHRSPVLFIIGFLAVPAKIAYQGWSFTCLGSTYHTFHVAVDRSNIMQQ
jgi:hypothetical protein